MGEGLWDVMRGRDISCILLKCGRGESGGVWRLYGNCCGEENVMLNIRNSQKSKWGGQVKKYRKRDNSLARSRCG